MRMPFVLYVVLLYVTCLNLHLFLNNDIYEYLNICVFLRVDAFLQISGERRLGSGIISEKIGRFEPKNVVSLER